MYSRKALRRMHPRTRDLARVINDTESVLRRLKNRLARVQDMEADSIALTTILASPSAGDSTPAFFPQEELR